MRRHITFILLTVCMVALAVSRAPVGNTQSKATRSSAQGRIAAEFIPSPSLPVDISSIIAVKDDDQTALKYTATNRTGGKLTSFDLIALVVDKDGAVRGGDVWRASEALRANAGDDLVHVMKAGVAAGDHLLLSLWRVSGESGIYELDKMQLDSVFKSRANLKSQASDVKQKKVRYGGVTPRTPPPPYCVGWYEYAASKCACGVKSFSCTESTGSVSWTCYTKAEASGPCLSESESE